MEAPAIQDARASDDVDIACWTLGSGPPLVQLTPLPSVLHLQFDWRIAEYRRRHERGGHERITREQPAAHGAPEIKTMGDGFMASFASAQKALECAIALQRAFPGVQLKVRIGINAGEPIAEDDDLFGASVIAAARIAAKAQGGEILVANVVRELVAGKGFSFTDRGETELPGFDDPVRLYEVRWR